MSSWHQRRGGNTYLTPVYHILSRKGKIELCQCLFEIKVPSGYLSNIQSLVSMKDLEPLGLKSHDCHALMQQLLPVAIRSVLLTVGPKAYRSSFDDD